jgi:hypothetical protein
MTAVAEQGDAADSKHDFTKPLAAVELVDEAGPHTLTVIQEGEQYYARSSDLEGVYEVSSTLAQSLGKKLEDFRNKKLFDFGFTDPAKLQLRNGGTSLTIEKKDDKWTLASDGGRELDSPKVQALIDGLRNLAATSFVSDNAAEQSKYGLGRPAIEAEVTPAQSDATEKVVITAPSAERVYAARQGQPTTYEVENSAVAEIQRATEDLLAKEEPAEEQSGSEKKEE